MTMKNMSKPFSLLVVLIVYVAAFLAGLLTFWLLPLPPVWLFLCTDVAATVVVWAFGLIFRNSSMYDPYWSVAPPILFVCFVLSARAFDATDVLFMALLTFWGVRLTLNWIIGWKGMFHQDWRYTMLREQSPALWPLTNFFGINMMPTLIVFVNMLPAYYCAQAVGKLSVLTVLGAAVCLIAVLLQIVSDEQMRRFRKDPANQGRHIAAGLWKYSRHPNYLGEVSFWWGVYFMMLGQVPGMWWLIFAPVLMTLLFVFISIPMMEKRLLATRPGYAAYKEATSMLLLLPPRRAA
jgi:steroid 5-alpha reductase family enzyme